MNGFEAINRHPYLYLTGMGEPQDNTLALRIEEGRVSEVSVPIENFAIGHPIKANEQSAAYAVYFRGYVAYAVRNESYAASDPADEYTGRRAQIFTRSKFLEFVRAGTFATDEYPGPVAHYSFVCSNHVVDVASIDPPEVRVIREGAGTPAEPA